ncbi:predicted protein [Naegleria gruberi]|uniref:Predicted protein n=1 Tax=Naegleria gruberi TaxID=5762 RepID=D2UYY3_NAEGR|nr:uncharacterized protein NAEGRDRAFT_61745 [Naegleria gruberi]EFC50051.1 predicted protein [Naegleria gruberi]|eukprot:XP_002682795.1 predicted protein [Naegleria gruberi strain NEG-M]
MSSFTLPLMFGILLIASTIHCFPTSMLSKIYQPHNQAISFSTNNLDNSTFTSRSLLLGDLYGFDGQCSGRNVSLVQIVTSSNQITLSSYWSNSDQIVLNHCYHVKDDYHLCQFSSALTPSSVVVCIKLDDDIQDDDEFDLAINFDIESCTSFDFQAKCRLDSGSVVGMIVEIKYPGDNSIRLRNYAIAALIILIMLCICCLISAAMAVYCCLIKRRREKLNQPFNNNANTYNEDEIDSSSRRERTSVEMTSQNNEDDE